VKFEYDTFCAAARSYLRGDGLIKLPRNYFQDECPVLLIYNVQTRRKNLNSRNTVCNSLIGLIKPLRNYFQDECPALLIYNVQTRRKNLNSRNTPSATIHVTLCLLQFDWRSSGLTQSFGFLVINVCNHGEHYQKPCVYVHTDIHTRIVMDSVLQVTKKLHSSWGEYVS